jgi:hypothetical protein
MPTDVRQQQEEGQTVLVLLIIVDLSRWALSGRTVPDVPGVAFADFAELSSALLARVRPDVVLSPLSSDAFDAEDVAQRLTQLGYSGRYRAVTPAVANPAAVGGDIRAVAPDLDFDLFQLA